MSSAPIPDPVRLRCALCKRAWQVDRAKYVRIAGTENAPDARIRYAAEMGCERAKNQTPTQMHDRCEIGYVGMG